MITAKIPAFGLHARAVRAACLLFLCPVTAAANTFMLETDSDLVGEVLTVQARGEDTLFDIARRHGVGYNGIRMANPGASVMMPGQGTEITIPLRFVLPGDAPREGIVINLTEKRLYYYPGEGPVEGAGGGVVTHPIGIGRVDRKTPTTVTRVSRKATRPTWYPTEGVRADYAKDGRVLPRVIPPGPDNPLGEYAIYLSLPAYLLHGTIRPDGVGMRVSQGCIRLYPEDIESLYGMVPVGTPVYIIEQAVKLGIHQRRLYLEVHPPLAATEADEDQILQADITEVVRRVDLLMASRGDSFDGAVDWDKVKQAVEQPTGMPVDITSPGGQRQPAVPVPVNLHQTLQH